MRVKHFYFSVCLLIAFCKLSVAQRFIFSVSNETVNENALSEERALYLPSKKKATYVRPFITDDARVVGNRLAQMESWVRFDKESGQHWILGAVGPNDKLELTIGGVYGYQVPVNREKNFTYALPLLQAKYLFKPYKPRQGPGIAAVLGSFLPVGQGAFKPPGYGSFGFATITQCIGKTENYLVHLNLGANYLHIDGSNNLVSTWGVGTQLKLYQGWNFVGELFSGDPYIPGTGTAFQCGYRYFFNDFLQIDMTVGKGIAGQTIMPLWGTAGVRVVSSKLLNPKKR